jgi:hypothetical protein
METTLTKGLLTIVGTSATTGTQELMDSLTTVGTSATAGTSTSGNPETLKTPVADGTLTAVGTAATAEFSSHSRDSRKVNISKIPQVLYAREL